MAKADVEFYHAMPLWRCKVLSRRSKLRMYRRYLMILVYAGASCWILDVVARRALNHWNGAKMAAITGNTHKEENARRRVEICLILRYWRRRLLGEILRAHPDDIWRSEVVQHAVGEKTDTAENPRVHCPATHKALRCTHLLSRRARARDHLLVRALAALLAASAPFVTLSALRLRGGIRPYAPPHVVSQACRNV
eukprot:COSAG06_NODE_846_length_11978_cov_4.785420_3_plen_195_part_00